LTLLGSSVFAELIRSLEPYLDEIVFVGGWVQALYVLEVEGRVERRCGRRGAVPLVRLEKASRHARRALGACGWAVRERGCASRRTPAP
jgi:hypothetical protein